jgi:hypothetical protein
MVKEMEKIPMYDENGKLTCPPKKIACIDDVTMDEENLTKSEKNKLKKIIQDGFKWPSSFKCGNLKRNIGDAGLEQIQKLAWLRYISGQIPDEFIVIIDGERTIISEKREDLDKYMDDQFITPCLSQDGSRYFDMCLTALQESCYQSTIKQLEPLAEEGKKRTKTKQKQGKNSAITRLKKTEEIRNEYCNFREKQEKQGFKARTINNLFYKDNPDCNNTPKALTDWWNKYTTQT